MVLTVLDAMLARWPEVQHFAYGLILLFALYAMPEGLAGLLARVLPRRSLLSQDERRAIEPWSPPQARSRGQADFLVVKDLYKAFGGVVPTNKVSFSLKEGSIVSLIGPTARARPRR